MIFTAKQIGGIIQGNIEGDPNIKVNSFSKIEEGEKGSLTFLSNLKYIPYAYKTKASVIVVDKDFLLEKPISATIIKVKNPRNAFSILLDFYYNKFIEKENEGIDNTSSIHKTVKFGKKCYVGVFSSIGENSILSDDVKIHSHILIGNNVKIGKGTVIFSGAKILSNSIIGKDCVIHNGAVIGSEGFGFRKEKSGSYKKIPHIGNVVIGDNVSIGTNTCIDRATLGSTRIKNGVKLDNLIQIAHNVEIGENTVIAAQVGVAGSTKIGKNCEIGGQTGISGHLVVGDNVKTQGQTGIIGNIADNQKIQGTPAMNYNNYYKSYIHFKKLPKYYKNK